MKKGIEKQSNPKKKKGFSLVELLAVIVIIGAISVFTISSVSRYISKARNEKLEQNRKNAVMATQLYLQSNRQLLPQNIGDSTKIKLSDLKKNNYLKEDILNIDGETCMDNSVVRVYKYDEESYSYSTYLYCGDEVAPADLPVQNPVVLNFKFTDKRGKVSNTFTDVRNAQFTFMIKGAEKDDSIGIYSYRYIIYVKKQNDTEYTEVYNSEFLKGGLEPSITVTSKNLSSYVDLTGYTMFNVKVQVYNEQGGYLDFSSNTVTTDGFEDNEKPTCGNVYGDDKNNNEWINKTSYTTGTSSSDMTKRSYPGRISVECSDAAGSGCKRDLFTRTWPNDDKSPSGEVDYRYGARWGIVTISDNAVNRKGGNNTTDCFVRVNVDVQAPSVILYMYNAKTYTKDRKNTSNAVATINVHDATTVNGNVPNGTIKANSIKNAVGTTDEKWLNLANYPDGIILDAVVGDNLYLASWTWEVNDSYVAGGTSDSVIRSTASILNTQNENGSPVSGTFSKDVKDTQVTNLTQLAQQEKGDTSGNINGLKITLEGKRYGRLTVYDKAGNKTVVHVYANLDRTAPPIPKVSYLTQSSRDSYTASDSSNYESSSNWINQKLYAYVKDQKTDHESPNTKGNDLSGWEKFGYRFRKQANKKNKWEDAVYSDTVKTFDFGVGIEINNEGTHRVAYRSCDKAENCSSYSSEDYVKIDLTKPTCAIKKTYSGTSGPNAAGWLKAGESVTLSHSCTDQNNPYESGCNNEHADNLVSYKYESDIETNKAGAGGNNIGGYVWDYAGNRSDECPKNETVKIDTQKPTCTVNATYSGTSGPNAAGWLKIGEKVTLTHPCTDTTKNGVSSGCDNNSSKNKQSKVYDDDIDTPNAGANGVNNGGTVVDIAGNESDECPKMQVRIDHTAPTCSTTVSYPNGEPTGGWLGSNGYGGNKKTAVVSQVCTEVPKNGVSSNCSGTVKSYTYNMEVNTTIAGAAGNGNGGGKVYDIAGNGSNDCPANQTVKIDYTAPSCIPKITAGGSAYTSGSWTNQSITITAQCSENGTSLYRSGCLSDRFDTYSSDMDRTIYFNYSNTNNARAEDVAGNYSNCDETYSLRIDKTPPTASCSTSGYYYNDSNSNLSVSSSSYDSSSGGASSGISDTYYSLEGASFGTQSSKSLSCYTDARYATARIKVVDRAGNSAEADCGSVYVPGCCDSQTDWKDGTNCSALCDGGTYDRYKYSNYNGQLCDSKPDGGSTCNTRGCCSSTTGYPGTCSSASGCGMGSRYVYYYSDYDDRYCDYDIEPCDTGNPCKEDIDPNRCGMWITRTSGDYVYFTSNRTCEIDSVSGGTQTDETTVYSYCPSSCTVYVTWTSGIYTFHGQDYAYTSWLTLKCGSYHCTPDESLLCDTGACTN